MKEDRVKTLRYEETHTGPYKVVAKMGYECYEKACEQLKFFQQVAEKIHFKDWYFGHLHKDVDIENFHCRIDEVTKICD